jgi:two-component system response regulator
MDAREAAAIETNRYQEVAIMLGKSVDDKRRAQRKRMLKGGTIAFSARHATVPCVVRDVSGTGARLQVQNGMGVPDTFELIVELDGLEAQCAVVWRKPSEVGVEFLGTPQLVPPKRSQVIDSSTGSLAKPQLRRTPPQYRGPAAMPGSPPPSSGAHGPEAPPPAPAPSRTRNAARTIPILIAEDDPDDRLLLADAFRDSNFNHPIEFVADGEELLAYLGAGGRFAGRQTPGLILLDLNMPRMDGRTALMHLKADRAFRRIPVIVLTTSRSEDDIQRTYDLGVSAYMTKPGSYSELVELVRSLNGYWSQFAMLPAS